MMNFTAILISTLTVTSLQASSSNEEAFVALKPIPLKRESLGRYGSGELFSAKNWSLLKPGVLNGVVFIQPSRNEGLGPRTEEFFDRAFLRFSPRPDAAVGVSQPLIERGLPVVAQAGDRYQVGLNVRGESNAALVQVGLLTANGDPVVWSESITPGAARRYFVDLDIPADRGDGEPLLLAIQAVRKDEGDSQPAEVDQVSIARITTDGDEFTSLFNGKDLAGWTGGLNGYGVEDGAIRTYPKRAGGNIYTEDPYEDFVFRFRFKLEPGSNNGIAIRAPLSGDAAYQGMEVQVLENAHPKYAGLKPWQFHGSIYGVAPAMRGYQRPAGEWNDEEIRVEGRNLRVTLNGKVILDVDLDEAIKDGTPSGQEHPGTRNTSGHIGFCGHGDVVRFKDLRIQEL